MTCGRRHGEAGWLETTGPGCMAETRGQQVREGGGSVRGERVLGPTKHLVPGGRSGRLSKAGLVRCGLRGHTGVNDMEVIHGLEKQF